MDDHDPGVRPVARGARQVSKNLVVVVSGEPDGLGHHPISGHGGAPFAADFGAEAPLAADSTIPPGIGRVNP
mgnify:CR=1 FL=1